MDLVAGLGQGQGLVDGPQLGQRLLSCSEGPLCLGHAVPRAEQLQLRPHLGALQVVLGIEHAGEILIGKHSPFSLANYVAGPNAVLPTGGNARTFSPVSVRDFQKYSSVVYAMEYGLDSLADTAATLAEYEGFPAHAAALKRRHER